MNHSADILRFTLPMMRGESVRAVQAALAALQLLPPEGVDGVYGPQSKAAVAAFQASRNLAETGVVDSDTRALLLGRPPAEDAATRPEPIAVVAGSAPHIVPPEWLPDARPQRIILHWTAGGPVPSQLDLEHYHFLVPQSGPIARGRFSIADNDSTADNLYAAHVLSKNTRSIGIAVCGMAEAREAPFHPGPTPMIPEQLDRMAVLVAQICARYNLRVTRETVLAHGEVQEFLGVLQLGKWDPLVLPWKPELSKREVGEMLRAMVTAALTGELDEGEAARPLDLIVSGQAFPNGAVAVDGETWAKLGPLVDRLDWEIERVEAGGVALWAGGRPAFLTLGFAAGATTVEDAREGSVRVQELAEQLDLAVSVSDDGQTISLDGEMGGGEVAVDAGSFRRVTVASGGTLLAIARREMGNAGAWQAILSSDGQPFSEESARRLRAGEQVLVPVAPAPAAAARPDHAPPDEAELDEVAAAVAEETHPLNRDAARRATPRLLRACFRRGVVDPAHLAYVLATAEHETNFGRTMVEVWKSTPAQLRYEASRLNGKRGDGKLFRGRGYVQLTFRANYRRFGAELDLPLEDDPDRAADPDIAPEIMAVGMSHLGYCSPRKVLSAYGFGDSFDFFAARDIVNGDKDIFAARYNAKIGVAVGGQAQKYYRILTEAAQLRAGQAFELGTG